MLTELRRAGLREVHWRSRRVEQGDAERRMGRKQRGCEGRTRGEGLKATGVIAEVGKTVGRPGLHRYTAMEKG